MKSVEEYINLILNKLNELVIEDISYSDYDQMTDWLCQVQQGHIAEIKKLEQSINDLEGEVDHMREYW